MIYGIHLTLLIYLLTYLAAKALSGMRSIPIIATLVKYILYYFAIDFGFKHLPATGILVGFTLSIYGSLVVLYWINREQQTRGAEIS